MAPISLLIYILIFHRYLSYNPTSTVSIAESDFLYSICLQVMKLNQHNI